MKKRSQICEQEEESLSLQSNDRCFRERVSQGVVCAGEYDKPQVLVSTADCDQIREGDKLDEASGEYAGADEVRFFTL